MNRLARSALACALTLASGLVDARPYSVEDILSTEAFGKILVSPGGRWLVFERLIPLGAAPSFGLDAMEEVRDRLYRVDLRRPAPARPLIPISPDAGTVALGFSPDGERLAIGRLKGETWQLGVVVIASGAVRWFDISPDYFAYRTTLQWVSAHEVVTIAQPHGVLPWIFRTNLQDAQEMPRLWAASRDGTAPTVTAVGSGRYVAVKPAAPPTRLLLLDVDTGRTRMLGEGDFQQLEMSPDGRHVALVAQAETIRISRPGPIREEMDLRRRRLSIVDLATGTRWTPCADCDVPYATPLWSADSRQLLFFARHGDQDWAMGQPWMADVASRSAQPIALAGLRPSIIETAGDYDRPAIGWLGATPILFASPTDAPSARADWYSLDRRAPRSLTAAVDRPSPNLILVGPRSPLMLAGDGAWRVGLDGSIRVLPPTPGLKPVGIGFGQSRGAAALLAWRALPGRVSVIDQAGRSSPFRLDGKGEIRPVAASPDNSIVVATETQAQGVETLLVQPAHGPATIVATINRQFADLSVPVPIAIHHRLGDGRAVTSWLYLPADGGEGAKPPLVTIPYPGLVWSDAIPAVWQPGVGKTYTNVQALVGHGYAVLVPSMPDLAPSDQAPFAFAEQVLTAVDAVIARGDVDPRRLALWGHSYGGYTAATIASETDRFSAIIASNGVYDLTSFQGTFTPRTRLNPGYGQSILPWSGWTESEQPRLAATPWSNPARYVANSPVYHADRIRTPMLIIAGDRDISPLQQSEQMFSGLYRQGKDAMLLTYWGGDHVPLSPANVRDVYARIFAWLDGHFEGRDVTPPAAQGATIASSRSDRSIRVPSAP